MSSRGEAEDGAERATRPAAQSAWISNGLFVSLLWLIHDRRIERVLVKHDRE